MLNNVNIFEDVIFTDFDAIQITNSGAGVYQVVHVPSGKGYGHGIWYNNGCGEGCKFSNGDGDGSGVNSVERRKYLI
jgi:hypothetical protein